jgi:hypothetical protein
LGAVLGATMIYNFFMYFFVICWLNGDTKVWLPLDMVREEYAVDLADMDLTVNNALLFTNFLVYSKFSVVYSSTYVQQISFLLGEHLLFF